MAPVSGPDSYGSRFMLLGAPDYYACAGGKRGSMSEFLLLFHRSVLLAYEVSISTPDVCESPCVICVVSTEPYPCLPLPHSLSECWRNQESANNAFFNKVPNRARVWLVLSTAPRAVATGDIPCCRHPGQNILSQQFLCGTRVTRGGLVGEVGTAVSQFTGKWAGETVSIARPQ